MQTYHSHRSPTDSVEEAKNKNKYSAGVLFAEFASGTNIAHFHHGDDKKMRLCLRCTTVGMFRVVPWTQSGGAGLSPSVHNAPPIMALPIGETLADTLGLSLIPLPARPGKAKWTGHFIPTGKDMPIPYLEAFTWNPRRIHLLAPEVADVCWGCGRTNIHAVGPIKYLKNEATQLRKPGNDRLPFEWQDPSAFYGSNEPKKTKRAKRTYETFKAIKSWSDKQAADHRDLTYLLRQDDTPESAVVHENTEHERWYVVVPCTNPGNNKTFDHRGLELTGTFPEALRAQLAVDTPTASPKGLDGWVEHPRPSRIGGAVHFVRAAERLLTESDWADLAGAAFHGMHDSPAAFDVLSGLFWGLRNNKVVGLPSRNAAWLVLKLMAVVPARARLHSDHAGKNLLQDLPKRQPDELRKGQRVKSIYPVSFPRGSRLEAAIRDQLDKNDRGRDSLSIDWAGLCYDLEQLLD